MSWNISHRGDKTSVNPIYKAIYNSLGGGFKDLLFSTLSGEMIQFD